ncbi:hypothetical protein IY145_17815 [Methylosinus sp. H3A]|uniref:hypothetical protein n=1 Tax=Methylosinus sp. H3A TaxID=2785786 RepID=UPI0018C21B32|nr:hypothetical protein [Methylosinus sp. H3A]MBG0811216.1 hypothetical protein [Methylosinus sp. H3A]
MNRLVISVTCAAVMLASTPALADETDSARAAATALAGGELPDKLTEMFGVTSRLIARGTIAETKCGRKNQVRVSMWVMKRIGSQIMEDDPWRASLKLATLFAVDDFNTLGKSAWCADYEARAMAANALFKRSGGK